MAEVADLCISQEESYLVAIDKGSERGWGSGCWGGGCGSGSRGFDDDRCMAILGIRLRDQYWEKGQCQGQDLRIDFIYCGNGDDTSPNYLYIT